MIQQIIFYVCAALALGGGLGTVLNVRNTVASALCLLTSMLALAVLFVQLQAQFIGILQVMVYAGAIVVLFLFVIMLLNLRGGSFGTAQQPAVKLIGACLIAFSAFKIALLLGRGGARQQFGSLAEGFGGVRSVAELLFTQYMLVVQVSGVLLLAGVVGALILAKKELD